MTRMMFLVVLCMTMSAPGNAVAGDRYAFLVGVRNYDPASFVSLRYTEDDVTGLAKALKRSGYDSSNVVLMTQSEGANNFKRLPLAKQIRDQLQLLLSELQADDTLIVAFSGHGVQFEGEDTIYFCPVDASLTDKKSLVSLTEVYSLLADEHLCKAGTKVLLVDACRNDPRSENLKKSGGLIELAPAGVSTPPEPPGGVVAFFSCSKGQVSHEHPDLKHGIFANFLIDAFQGKGDLDADGEISLAELEQYSVKETQKFARTRLGVSQLPERRGVARGVASLGHCVTFIDGSVPGLQLSQEENSNRRARAQQLVKELETYEFEGLYLNQLERRKLACVHALLGNTESAISFAGPPDVISDRIFQDGHYTEIQKTEYNALHFNVLGMLAKKHGMDAAFREMVNNSVGKLDYIKQDEARDQFQKAFLATFKNQRVSTVQELLGKSQVGTFSFYDVINYPREVFSASPSEKAALARVLVKDESDVVDWMAVIQPDAMRVCATITVMSHEPYAVLPFAFAGDTNAVESIIETNIRKQKEAWAKEGGYAIRFLAAEGYLDSGYTEAARACIKNANVAPGTIDGLFTRDSSPYAYPLRTALIHGSGPLGRPLFHHPLGRLGDEVKARELNNGRVSTDYVFGMLADID